jgi:hypothetical protein
MALGYFMTVLIESIPTESMLSLLRNIGLVSHLRTLLQNTENVESLNTGLLLLNSSLKMNVREFTLECDQMALPHLLERLAQHLQPKISERAGILLDSYFKL